MLLKTLSVLLPLVLVGATDDTSSGCWDYPFDIETDLIFKDQGAEVECSEKETLWMANQIARDINYVIVKKMKYFGVIKSQTRICKNGELLAQDEKTSRKRNLRWWNMFVYRGSGNCVRLFHQSCIRKLA